MKKFLVVLLFLVGCTDAETSSITSYGSQFKVTVYSGGKEIKTFTSTGKVQWHDGGGGCEFQDVATNKHVRISGTIIAEQQ
jgi:hypothetical protein